jgi:hypothetical protein
LRGGQARIIASVKARSPEVVRGLMLEAAAEVLSPSPLYRRLAAAAAEDAEILALAATARIYPPFMLFIAVHFLLLDAGEDPLAAYYPSVSGRAGPPEDAFPAFRSFVMRHHAEIADLLARRVINKTDLRRGACLRALLVEAARRLGAEAVHLVDLGCGAGLNLLLDRWSIAYRGVGEAGPRDAGVRFAIDVRGGTPPLAPMPRLASRTGIDTERIDAGSSADERWLLAHLFPEETALIEQTRSALAELRRAPPEVLQGDAAALLPGVVAGLDRAVPVVVMHSLAVGFFYDRERAALQRALTQSLRGRPSARIAMEKHGSGTVLGLCIPAARRLLRVGESDLDGRWLNWLG